MRDLAVTITPVKNPSRVRSRGKTVGRNPSPVDNPLPLGRDPQNRDIDSEDVEYTDSSIDNDTLVQQTTPLAKTSTVEKSPFSKVNVFQSPKTERKRRHEIDTTSSRKKREITLAEIEHREQSTPVLKRPQKVSIPSTPSTPLAAASASSLQYQTPIKRHSEPVVPNTAPVAARNVRNSFVDGRYTMHSTGKPALASSGAGRRVSFMPPVSQLQMSNGFSQQLSSSIKPEKKETDEKWKVLQEAVQEEEKSFLESADDKRKSFLESADKKRKSILEKVRKEFEILEEEVAAAVELEDDAFEANEYLDDTLEGSRIVPFLQVLGVLLLFATGSAFARWWVEEKIAAGYCEAGFIHWKPHYSHMTPSTLGEYFDRDYLQDQATQILDYVRPECQPCPMHAICYTGLRAVCEPGFVKEESMFAKFLPIAPVCQPDTQTRKRVQALTRRTVLVLRDRNAEAECSANGVAEIEEEELRKVLYGMKSASLGDDEFNELWTAAVEDLSNEEEVVLRQVEIKVDHEREIQHKITSSDSSGHALPVDRTPLVKRFFRSTSLANISVTCAIKRSVIVRINHHWGKLLTTIIGGITYLIGRRWFVSREERRQRAVRLASIAIARLKRQRQLAHDDDRGRTSLSVPVPQLRDEVQSEVTSLDMRKRVWKDVELLVETNANVRARQSEVEGEIMRVWEWVGV